MDALTHVFLPLTVLLALAHEPWLPPVTDRRLLLGVVALVPDLDKLVGMQGLGHSLVTLVPLVLLVALAERRLTGRTEVALLVGLLLASHLLLDVLDGGPVPPLFPLWDGSLGLRFPLQVAFGPDGPAFRGPLVALAGGPPREGYATFGGVVSGFGVASLLAFLAVVAGRRSGVAA